MKYKFAKLFNIEDYQVLVTKDHDNDEQPIIRQTTWCDIGEFSMSGAYATEETRDLFFDSYEMGDALDFIVDMKQFTDVVEDDIEEDEFDNDSEGEGE